MSDPLTDDEVQALRDMLKQQERVRWAWATSRIFVKWIAATIAAIFASYQAIKDTAFWRALN